MTTTNEHTERPELIKGLRDLAEIDFDNLFMRAAAMLEAQPAEQAASWPNLDKPARVGGASFGKGVSARLVVECAQRMFEYDAEERMKTSEQKRADEAKRRQVWDMLNGPVDTTPPTQPAREWVGLTEKELWKAIDGCANKYDAAIAVQDALREKNAGQPAADDKAGGEPVAKFFLPPALHDGIAENTAGTYRLRVTGLTIRQIKDIFEDKFLGSMMWANGAAYPTDGVEIRFVKDKPDTTPPAQPAREWVEVVRSVLEECDVPKAYQHAIIDKLREKNAGQPAADKAGGDEPVAYIDKENLPLSTGQSCLAYAGPGPANFNRAAVYTHPQPQADVVSPDKAKNFYLAVCNFLVWIGREGTVHADDPIIDQLSNALHDIDGGVFKDSLKWPQAEVPDIDAILKGIDKGELEDPDGWWETSAGAEFGAKKLAELKAAMFAAAQKPQDDLPAILKKQAS